MPITKNTRRCKFLFQSITLPNEGGRKMTFHRKYPNRVYVQGLYFFVGGFNIIQPQTHQTTKSSRHICRKDLRSRFCAVRGPWLVKSPGMAHRQRQGKWPPAITRMILGISLTIEKNHWNINFEME